MIGLIEPVKEQESMKKIAVKVELIDRGKATLPLKYAGKKFGPEFKEFDRVFLPMNYKSAYGSAAKSPKLIIRTSTAGQKDTYQLIFKRFVSDNTIICYQTQIFDHSQLAHIIAHIGYEFYGQVNKIRSQVLVGDVLLSLDTIDDHETYYLKIERTLPDDAWGDVRELEDVLTSLDIDHMKREQEYIEIEKRRD